MKVKELIALLQTMPQNATVTAYNAHETTSLITKHTVRYYEKGCYYNRKGKFVERPNVDIMGSL